MEYFGESIAQDCDFILALNSYGNVGQICLDALISTLYSNKSDKKIKRVGYIESSSVLPITGYDQFGTNEERILCLPIEVYRIENTSTYLILMRSMCLRGEQVQFSLKLYNLLKNTFAFRNVLILTGASLQDVEPSYFGSQFILEISQPQKPLPGIFYQSQSWTELKNVYKLHPNVLLKDETAHSTMFQLNKSFNQLELPSSKLATLDSLPQGMILAKYFMLNHLKETPSDSRKRNVILVGQFCTEGDNIPDGLQLARFVCNIIPNLLPAEAFQGDEVVFFHPKSWDNRL